MSDQHLFHTRMPRNTREFFGFMLVISLISVNVIPVLVSGLTVGFSLDTWLSVLRVMPVLWIAVIATVLLTLKPAEILASRFVRQTDSFSAHVLVNTLCGVLLISIVMTIVGTWIGTGAITTDPLTSFVHLWPRNFMIAFLVEALFAQPVARLAMRRYHRHIDAATEQGFDA